RARGPGRRRAGRSYHALRVQRVLFRGRQPKDLSEHEAVVLTQAGRAARDAPVRLREVDGQPVDPDSAHLGLFDLGPEAPGVGVCVVVDALRWRGNLDGGDTS